jgi:hypothetical protein
MSMRTHRVVILVAATLLAGGCAGKLEEVVRAQAARDLRCPEADIDVHDRRSDNYVRDYTVNGCGQTAHYQAACNMTDTCVAYRPDMLGKDAAASEALTAGVDAVPESEPAEEPPVVPGEWTVVETVRPKPPPAPPATVQEVDAAVTTTAPPAVVTLRNVCPETISLFIGEAPESGEGRMMSLASTNMTQLRVPPGTKLWLLDRDQRGLTGVTLEASMHEVDADCSGLSAR